MFNFQRRIGRLNYFYGVLLSIAVFVVGAFALFAIKEAVNTEVFDQIVAFLLLGLLLVVAIYNISLLKQRSNDISNDQAVLITILAIFSGLAFVLFFIPSEKKANRYGSIPKKISLP
jgi:uncharacterized membrane protein YhaH (DUF805 family)